MKKFLLCAIVLGSAALLAAGILVPKPHSGIVRDPEIQVFLGNLQGGGGMGLAARNGWTGSGSSAGNDWHAADSYKVSANTDSRFVFLAHYDVEQNHILTHVDVALPVQAPRPDWSSWTQVDSNLKACAFYTGSTLNHQL